jgi:predicted enzyme related to lactoylglutathione lyase
MLANHDVHLNIPVKDLDRARSYYADVLGLTPVSQEEDGLIYGTPRGGFFMLYQTEFAGTAGHTLGQFDVDDIETEVKNLQSRGVTFERYEIPGVEWDDVIARSPLGRIAWFKDCEGNILCLDQRAAAPTG